MLSRISAPVLLALFVVSGLAAPLQADGETTIYRTTVPEGVAAKESAAAVSELPPPPESKAITLADLPKETADMLNMIYQWKEGEPLFTSTAAPGVIQKFYADELAKCGYSSYLMLDAEGKPISPAFTYACELGAIRVVAADDAVPEKTLVALVVLH
jgi:hypothetical protein